MVINCTTTTSSPAEPAAKPVWQLLSCFMLMLMLFGCSDDNADTASSTTASAKIKVRFASIETVGQNMVPYAMVQYGLDKKYGLDIEIVPYAGPGQQYLMARSGSADVIAGNWLDLHRQRKGGGAQIRAFYGFQRYSMPIIVKPSSPITSFEDLRGKKLGMFGTTFVDWVILRMAGKNAYGLDVEKDTELTQTTPQLLGVLLEKDRIDAAFQFTSLVVSPVAQGKQRILTSVPELMSDAGFDPESFYLLWCITDDWMRNNPGAIVKLRAAMHETYARLQTDDAIWPSLAKFIGLTATEDVEVYREFTRKIDGPPISKDMVESTQKVLDGIVETMGDSITGFTQIDLDAFIFPASP